MTLQCEWPAFQVDDEILNYFPSNTPDLCAKDGRLIFKWLVWVSNY